MAQRPQTLPPGNDPRLRLDPDDLEAASRTAMPQVARRAGMGEGLGIAAGIIGVGALGMVTFFTIGNKPAPPKPAPAPAPVQAPPQSVLGPVDPEANPPPAVAQQPALMVQPQMTPQPTSPDATIPPVDPNAARAPALVIDNSVAPPPAAAAPASGAATGVAPPALNANDQFAARVNGDIYQKAQKIGDPSQIVPQGAVIPAVLETAINSDLPGYTRAIVSRDIRSFDGTTVLIPHGSRLVGQYKSGLTSAKRAPSSSGTG